MNKEIIKAYLPREKEYRRANKAMRETECKKEK